MSQPIQDVENIVPLPAPLPRDAGNAGYSFLKAPLRILGALFIAPVLVIAAIISFMIVLVDFAIFRLHDIRAGHPEPKGLWEF